MPTSSRDRILNKLREARRPFEDAPPRPAAYMPVTQLTDTSPDALLEKFTEMLVGLSGEVYVVEGDQAACDKVLELLASHEATHILAWDFAHIPINGLDVAIRDAGIEITQPTLQDDSRPDVIAKIDGAQVGITGVDAAIATTGTLAVSTGPGRGRIPTVLPPVYIPIITLDQLVPNIEAWLADERADGMTKMRDRANVAFISGPSRTGDIEMELILGVHGPGVVQAVVKR